MCDEKKIRDIVNEITEKSWMKPTIVGAKGKICECSDSYEYISSPSYGMVCSDSGYIKECDDC